jgi:uncharacterized protein YbjT (DUF2867 family)
MRTAILAGGTGLIGRYCLGHLMSEYERVISLVRRPTGHPVDRVISFDSIDTQLFEPGADVFCALGTTIRKSGSREAFRTVDYEYVVALARRAAAWHARQFLVVSSVGASTSSSNFYLRTKGEMEQSVSALRFHAIHIFRPSLLLGERQESRPAEKMAATASRALSFAFAGPMRKYRPVEAYVVAAAMVRAAKSGTGGVHVYEYHRICALAAPR